MESMTNTTKTKAEIKAERREKQELQKAAKLAKKEAKMPNKSKNVEITQTNIEEITHNRTSPQEDDLISVDIALEIERLSLMWTNGHFIDSTCLALALVDSLASLLSESSAEEIRQVVDSFITLCTQKIPLPTDAESFINYLKSCIPVSSCRDYLLDALENFRRKRLLNAVELVGSLAKRVLRLRSSKSVAVFGYTLSLMAALTDWEEPLDEFLVYIIECSPTKAKASVVMEKLTKQGIVAYYVNLSAIASILPNVDLVLVGCETVYADGSVRATSGTSVVLLTAESYRVPVYVLYETVKLSVQVCAPTMGSGVCEVVSRRFPMVLVSETDIHSAVLGFSRRSVNIQT